MTTSPSDAIWRDDLPATCVGTGPDRRMFCVYVQSFYWGYPDGGSICVDACCRAHYKPGTVSSWNTTRQHTMAEDGVRLRSYARTDLQHESKL